MKPKYALICSKLWLAGAIAQGKKDISWYLVPMNDAAKNDGYLNRCTPWIP